MCPGLMELEDTQPELVKACVAATKEVGVYQRYFSLLYPSGYHSTWEAARLVVHSCQVIKQPGFQLLVY